MHISLRPRQKKFVLRSIEDLEKHSSALGIAPTGAGKTVMFCEVIKRFVAKNPSGRILVLQHRNELVLQNEKTLKKIFPEVSTGIFNAAEKDTKSQVIFAMAQTLARLTNLEQIPKIDLLVIDEAHHAKAPQYIRIVKHLKNLNPNLMLFGVTATPYRGDKKEMGDVFEKVSDEILPKELIESNHLVKPKIINYAKKLGVYSALTKLKASPFGDYNEKQVADILNKKKHNDTIVQKWKTEAGDRQTVVFCSTIKHVEDVTGAFKSKGVKADMVHSKMPKRERIRALKAYDRGEIQVLVNSMVLTEGWDCPQTSCIVLLRPSSHKSTVIQMIGRGLRIIDQHKFPQIIKKNCTILDFGTGTLIHNMFDPKRKECPGCTTFVDGLEKKCFLCGYDFFSKTDRDAQKNEGLKAGLKRHEIELLSKSHLCFVDVTKQKICFGAQAQHYWNFYTVFIILKHGLWCLVGAENEIGERPSFEVLFIGKREDCIKQACDWFFEKAPGDFVRKRVWKTDRPTSKQLQYIPLELQNKILTKYEASLFLTFKFISGENRAAITNTVLKQRSTQPPPQNPARPVCSSDKLSV